MTMEETATFLEELLEFFPEFKVTNNTTRLWQEVTNFAYYKDMRKCLFEYAKSSQYTPKPYSIIQFWDNKGYSIVPVRNRNPE